MRDDPETADRIEALALECLEQLATEGEGVVDRVCADHPQLADRVRGLLHELESVGMVDAIEPEPTRDIGDFRLLKKVGQGGMGVVWLAEQKSLHRRVALKLLRPGFQESARVRERFRREVQALSKLEHSNVCTVYEAGEIDDRPYLAMRFVDGESLANVLARRRRSRVSTESGKTPSSSREVLDLVHLVEKVARALHAAHEAGVVHRDVKPGNVLLDENGEPVVVDFGLARADDPAMSALTQSGEPLGTPAYMAPEQISGDGSIDRRTDVYALGATLYECVTLHAPFEASTRDSLYRSIVHDPARNPRIRNRAVGRDLAAVLLKALEKQPRRRFGTAGEFADELQRILLHQPIRTRAPGPVVRTLRWCQRNPAATMVLGVVSLALVVAVLLLQRSVAAETRLRVLALLDVAENVADENPELGFKLAREALFLEDDPSEVEPQVVARVQQVMFRLRDSKVVREEPSALYLAEYSPGGKLLVTGGPDLPLTLHRAEDGEELAELPHHTPRQIPPVAFSPSGARIAAGDEQGRVYVYDLQAPSPTLDCTLGTDRRRALVLRVAWSHDGGRLVVAHAGGAVSVWTRDGDLQQDLPPADDRDSTGGRSWGGAAFLADGRVVATGAIWTTDLQDRQPLLATGGKVPLGVVGIHSTGTRLITHPQELTGACLWGLDGTLLYESEHERGLRHKVYDARFDHGGERFAVAFSSGRIEIRDAETTELLDVYRNAGSGIAVHLRFSPDDKRLAAANTAGTVEIWETGRKGPSTLNGHLSQVHSLTFSPDGEQLASASSDGTARLWHLRAPIPGIARLLDLGYPDFAQSDSGLIVTTGLGEVLLCDDEGNILRRESAGRDWSSVCTDPPGRRAIIGGHDRSLYGLDLESGAPPVKLENLQGTAFNCGLLGDGRIAFLQAEDMAVYLRADEGIERLETSLGALTGITVSRSGTKLLAGDMNGRWQLFTLRDENLIPSAPRETGITQYVVGLAFSSDGRRALVGFFDGHVQLWQLDPPPPQLLQSYHDHQHMAFSVAFSPDGQRIATGSVDGTARVFEPEASERPFVLTVEERAGVLRVEFLDDRRLVTASGDGSVCWWWLDAEDLDREIRRVPIGPLTEAEAGRFAHLLDR